MRHLTMRAADWLPRPRPFVSATWKMVSMIGNVRLVPPTANASRYAAR
jgi:hypothetical protein